MEFRFDVDAGGTSRAALARSRLMEAGAKFRTLHTAAGAVQSYTCRLNLLAECQSFKLPAFDITSLIQGYWVLGTGYWL